MTRMMLGLIASLFVTSLLTQARAQAPESPDAEVEVMTWKEGSPRPKATLDVARWLQGSWEGMLETAQQEHTVFAPVSGRMPSFVRAWGPDGTIWFYEIGVLAEVDGSLEFQLKHFTADLKGWEGKDEVVRHQLVAISDRALYFDGVTYVNEGPDRHSVYVLNSSGERKGQLTVVHQKRVKAAATTVSSQARSADRAQIRSTTQARPSPRQAR